MMTSENTIIMIANMKAAAIDDAIFSSALTSLNVLSSNFRPPRQSARPLSFGRNGCDRRVEFPQRIAAALAAGIEPLRPVFSDAFHQILEFRTGLRLQGFEFDALGLHRPLDLVVGFLHL